MRHRSVKLQFTHSAKRDLVHLVHLRELIAEENLRAAERISQRIKQSLLLLTDHPDAGVNVEDLPGVLELASADYIARYFVLDRTVTILRIWKSKEDR